MRRMEMMTAGGVTLAGLGALVGLAIGSGDGGQKLVAQRTQPVEVRTEIIRKTVNVYRREHPHHAPPAAGPAARARPARLTRGRAAWHPPRRERVRAGPAPSRRRHPRRRAVTTRSSGSKGRPVRARAGPGAGRLGLPDGENPQQRRELGRRRLGLLGGSGSSQWHPLQRRRRGGDTAVGTMTDRGSPTRKAHPLLGAFPLAVMTLATLPGALRADDGAPAGRRRPGPARGRGAARSSRAAQARARCDTRTSGAGASALPRRVAARKDPPATAPAIVTRASGAPGTTEAGDE